MASKTATMLSGWTVNVAIALTALRTNVMRSILTMLGVMIGVFAVTLAIAVGNGAQVSVVQTINSFGYNMAILSPEAEGDGPRRSFTRGRLTMRDLAAVEREIEGVRAIAPQLRYSIDLVVGNNRTTTNSVGITSGYGIVTDTKAALGRFIEDEDVRSAGRVIVLGKTVADELFVDTDPVGSTVRVNGIPFTVIGQMEEKGGAFGDDSDNVAFMPISTMRQRFAGDGLAGPDDVQLAFIGFEDGYSLSVAKTDLISLMEDRYNIREGQVRPFRVRTTEEFQEDFGFITSIMQAVLVAIASISLLVGGIGIMNIMLVSVTERTREIGLRMALGAKRSDIRNQFLVEAAVLCVLGGCVGLLLAWLSSLLVSVYADFPVPIGIGTALVAIVFSAFIGLLFGGYPAIRASRLSPIEALRSE
ncbi:MAG: ABC transporter permease [Pseudomonadota bacterium]